MHVDDALSVAIIGAGVVGRATGEGLLHVGHAVSFFDVDRLRVAELRRAGFEAFDPAELSRVRPDAYLISVPTPTRGGRCDLSNVMDASEAVARSLRAREDWACVVVRSTVPPGTTDGVVRPLLEELSGKRAPLDFGLVMNPEFLRDATARADFGEPRVIVVGSADERSSQLMARLYRAWPGVPRHEMPLRTAEATKYVANLFNATKISFFNELHRILSLYEVDSAAVAAAVTEGAEGLWNPSYGTRGGSPFGGACLPKDLEAFLAAVAELGARAPLLAAVREVNASFAALEDVATDTSANTPLSLEL